MWGFFALRVPVSCKCMRFDRAKAEGVYKMRLVSTRFPVKRDVSMSASFFSQYIKKVKIMLVHCKICTYKPGGIPVKS